MSALLIMFLVYLSGAFALIMYAYIGSASASEEAVRRMVVCSLTWPIALPILCFLTFMDKSV